MGEEIIRFGLVLLYDSDGFYYTIWLEAIIILEIVVVIFSSLTLFFIFMMKPKIETHIKEKDRSNTPFNSRTLIREFVILFVDGNLI